MGRRRRWQSKWQVGKRCRKGCSHRSQSAWWHEWFETSDGMIATIFAAIRAGATQTSRDVT